MKLRNGIKEAEERDVIITDKDGNETTNDKETERHRDDSRYDEHEERYVDRERGMSIHKRLKSRNHILESVPKKLQKAR